MVNTNKEIGFYTDCFGNEITEYEQIARYTVLYRGAIFQGDCDGWNKFEIDEWCGAIEFYNAYKNSTDIYIRDNEDGMVFENGDWS